MTSRTTRSTMAIVTVVALLASCGDDDGATDPPTTNAATTNVATATAATAPTSPPAEPTETTGDHAAIRVDVGALALADSYRLDGPVDETIAALGVEDFPRFVDEHADLIAASRAAGSQGNATTGLIYRVAVSGDHLDILEPFEAEFQALGSGNDGWITDIVPGDEEGMHVLRVTAPLFGDVQDTLTYQVRALLIDEADGGSEYRVTILREEVPESTPEMSSVVASQLESQLATADAAGFEGIGWDVFLFAEPSGPDSVRQVREVVYVFDTSGVDPAEFVDVVEAASSDGTESLTSTSPDIEVVLRRDDTDWILYRDGVGEAIVRGEN